MKKIIKKLLLPLFLVLMVIAMILLYSYLSNLSGDGRATLIYLVFICETAFFIISFLLSIILILKFHIKIKHVIKTTIIVGVLSVFGIILFASIIGNEIIGEIITISYPIVATIIIAKVVIFILEGEAEEVKRSHIFALTFMNPFLSLLPLLVTLVYGLANMSGHFGLK